MKAFLGGTFDPVHRGHLFAAHAACDTFGVDRVTLVLSARPTHRAPPVATVHDRWEMLQTAVDGDPQLAAWGGPQSHVPAYTVATLELLASRYAEPLLWLMGADGLRTFTSWQRWQDIPQLCNLGIFSRPGAELRSSLPGFTTTDNPTQVLRHAHGMMHIMRAAMPPISGTRIRETVRAGADASHWVLPPVWDYIVESGLYR